jgi:pimeloyl-ACP methyl ester carboxylesterase
MTPAGTSYQIQHADTPAGRIAYRETGNPGAPAALYVHGVIVNGHLWRHQLTAFQDTRHNIAVDLLGHGYSRARPGQGVTFEDQAEAIAGFLDVLGIGTVDLVANDSGTGIAQIFAVRHPGRLRSLVLTNGDVHDNWPPADFAGFTDRVKAGELPARRTASRTQPGDRRPLGRRGNTLTGARNPGRSG